MAFAPSRRRFRTSRQANYYFASKILGEKVPVMRRHCNGLTIEGRLIESGRGLIRLLAQGAGVDYS